MLNNFNPSVIANKIYDILEDYEVKMDVYDHEVIDNIINYLDKLNIKYDLDSCDWPNEEGGVCGVAFIDCDHPQLIMFDYIY